MGDEVQRASRVIAIPTSIDMVMLLGPRDAFLRVLGDRPAADTHVHGSQMTVTGEPGDVVFTAETPTELITIVRTGQSLSEEIVGRVINLAAEDLKPSEILTADIISTRGQTVRSKTLNQKHYVSAIDRHTVVFGIGPAGIGETYLAMVKAVQILRSKQVNRIILTRPVIETGERLDFLPGTLNDKIDSYLRPFYDTLHDMVEAGSVSKLLTSGTVEVAPLVCTRSRTPNDIFIILDEAQNTSSEQMKTFPTRFEFGPKMVATGDITQTGLPGRVRSGLRQVTQILDSVGDIAFCTLTACDVVRHKLVGRIVAAYDSYGSIRQSGSGK